MVAQQLRFGLTATPYKKSGPVCASSLPASSSSLPASNLGSRKTSLDLLGRTLDPTFTFKSVLSPSPFFFLYIYLFSFRTGWSSARLPHIKTRFLNPTLFENPEGNDWRAAGRFMGKNGEATPRSDLTTPVTWFGCLSVRYALMVLHTMLLTTAILGTTLMAIYLAQHSSSSPSAAARRLLNSSSLVELMQVDDLLISASGLTLWASGVGITVFGYALLHL